MVKRHMPQKKRTTPRRKKATPDDQQQMYDDLFERCLRNGLIEKTSAGYYFKPEFFDTLALYEQE